MTNTIDSTEISIELVCLWNDRYQGQCQRSSRFLICIAIGYWFILGAFNSVASKNQSRQYLLLTHLYAHFLIPKKKETKKKHSIKKINSGNFGYTDNYKMVPMQIAETIHRTN